MLYKFTIQGPNENSLAESIFQILRVRGFKTASLAISSTDSQLQFEFEVLGDRPIEALISQLRKIRQVRLLKCELD